MNTSDGRELSQLRERVAVLERRIAGMRGLVEALAWATFAAPLGILLLLVKRPGGLLMSQIFNLGHVSLSAIVAWAAFRVSSQVFSERPLRFHLISGMVAVGVLGGGLEVAQHYAPGEPSWWDMGIDVCGGLAATLVLAASRSSASKAAKIGLAVGGAFVFCLAIASAVRDIAKELERGVRFPVLATFVESERGVFLLNGGATLHSRATPDGARPTFGPKAPLLSLPAVPFAGIELKPPRGNWNEYSTLHMVLFSMAQKPVNMELRVHDSAHDGTYEDRFNQELVIQPGLNDFHLVLNDVSRTTSGRQLSLSEIDTMVLFAPSPAVPIDLFLGPWRLEGEP